MDNKMQWSIIKEKQSQTRDEAIPSSLDQHTRRLAVSTNKKVNILTQHFSTKLTIAEPEREPPKLLVLTTHKLTTIKAKEREAYKLLWDLDKKTVGLHTVGPHLRRCARELVAPVITLFNTVLGTHVWPQQWKSSNVVPVHKKGSKTEIKKINVPKNKENTLKTSPGLHLGNQQD